MARRHDPGVLGLAVLGGLLKEFTDTYCDTEDWRIYRASYALRIRQDTSSSEATMKSTISAADGNLRRRREISEPLKNNQIDALPMTSGLVGIRLRELIGSHKLCRIFEVRTRRQTFDLLLDEQLVESERAQTSDAAVRVGEVALYNSEIPLSDGLVRLSRVEVEVDISAANVFWKLESFVKAMEVALGFRATNISEYEAGLYGTGQKLPATPKARVFCDVVDD